MLLLSEERECGKMKKKKNDERDCSNDVGCRDAGM